MASSFYTGKNLITSKRYHSMVRQDENKRNQPSADVHGNRDEDLQRISREGRNKPIDQRFEGDVGNGGNATSIDRNANIRRDETMQNERISKERNRQEQKK